ncbi:MAG: hypothetical protein E7536_00070 [Ruminococcaceae bacterium]|nr:hypothetical protein [Oscillospiraceae bacterium]
MQNNVVFKTSSFGFNKREVMEYIASLCEQNAATLERLSSADAENAKCIKEKDEMAVKNSNLMEENNALLREIAEYKSTIESLNKRIDELVKKTSKFDEIEGAEEKANRLMMDSLRYSESCIKNAQLVSESINISTKNKIDKAKTCLNTVSSDFKTLTSQIEVSISEISDRLAVLSKGLDDSVAIGK